MPEKYLQMPFAAKLTDGVQKQTPDSDVHMRLI
jgi:hypothetical protein